MNENSEIILNNPKKHFFQIKLDQIWLTTSIKQQNTDKNIEHLNCFNLCKFCNKRLYNYLNQKSHKTDNKVATNGFLNNKLIRSDSDSLIINRKSSFDRLAIERRSLKYKKNNNFKK